jgi:hypothetical protein
VTCARE